MIATGTNKKVTIIVVPKANVAALIKRPTRNISIPEKGESCTNKNPKIAPIAAEAHIIRQ